MGTHSSNCLLGMNVVDGAAAAGAVLLGTIYILLDKG